MFTHKRLKINHIKRIEISYLYYYANFAFFYVFSKNNEIKINFIYLNFLKCYLCIYFLQSKIISL